MEPIIQTLTVAIILLIIGLTCTVIGIAGLAWTTTRNKRRVDQAANAVTSAENTLQTGVAKPPKIQHTMVHSGSGPTVAPDE